MLRVLVAPDFEITSADPDFPPALLDTLKKARDVTGSNYVSFWAQMGDSSLLSRVIVSTYPALWLHRYSEMDYSRIDPVLTKGLYSVGAVIFDHNNAETAELAEFGAEAMAHGIGRFTIGIPVHIGANTHAVATFATDMDVTDNADESSAALTRCREQAYIIAVAITERFFKSEQPKYNLTDREIEVLYWGSLGKTDQQTAEVMGISRWTVVAHVQSAKSKLRVNNKAAAIVRALELNLFTKFAHRL
ncbi:MAG: autoinducer binding domain-containing protein [Oricola sp.]